MDEWRKLALLLCVYGVLKELRPLEPFITRFFTTPPMNFTDEEINHEIYPISVYANMACLLLVFLVTDMLRYKPIIVLNSLAGIVLYVMLIFCRSKFAIQIVEVLYGLYIACEVAYYTYIYAKVDKSHYQEVTGYTRAAYLTGRALSGVASQFLFQWAGLQLMTLAKITLGVLIVSFFWAISLPTVTESIYFNRHLPDPTTTIENKQQVKKRTRTKKIKDGFKLLFEDLVAAFTQVEIHKFVFWWAACNGGYLQVLQFVQVLWLEITAAEPDSDLLLNGAVEAICTFMGAIGAFLFGQMTAIDWNRWGELGLAVGALALGSDLVIMASSNSIIVAYITYIIFSVVYNAFVTIAKSQIATRVKPDSTGLIFGITIFFALAIQTLITIVLVQIMKMSATMQFAMYGYYYLLIGAAFALKFLYSTIRMKMQGDGDLSRVDGSCAIKRTDRSVVDAFE